MRYQARRASTQPVVSNHKRSQRAQRLKRRGIWVAGVGLAVVVLSTHWVWALIAALLTLFLVFALDDEVKDIERDG